MENFAIESRQLKLCNKFRAVIRCIKAAFYRLNYQCVRWSKDSAEHLFQNMRPSPWNTRPSFKNTPPSFWGYRRKPKAPPSVLKARSRVCVITRPMLSQAAPVGQIPLNSFLGLWRYTLVRQSFFYDSCTRIYVLIIEQCETKFSRMDHVKFVEDSL